MCSHHAYLYIANLSLFHGSLLCTLIKVREDSKVICCHRHQPCKFHYQDNPYSSAFTPLTQKKEQKKETTKKRASIQKIRMIILKQEEIVNIASIFMCRIANWTTTYAIKLTKISPASWEHLSLHRPLSQFSGMSSFSPIYSGQYSSNDWHFKTSLYWRGTLI
jgi:hypothetical protein